MGGSTSNKNKDHLELRRVRLLCPPCHVSVGGGNRSMRLVNQRKRCCVAFRFLPCLMSSSSTRFCFLIFCILFALKSLYCNPPTTQPQLFPRWVQTAEPSPCNLSMAAACSARRVHQEYVMGVTSMKSVLVGNTPLVLHCGVCHLWVLRAAVRHVGVVVQLT